MILALLIYKRWWRWLSPEAEERRFRNGPELPFGAISKPDAKQRVGLFVENNLDALTKRERSTVVRIIREKYGLQEPKKSKLALKIQRETGLEAGKESSKKKMLSTARRKENKSGPFVFPKMKRKGGYYPRTLFNFGAEGKRRVDKNVNKDAASFEGKRSTKLGEYTVNSPKRR